jgi:hypothetical protein
VNGRGWATIATFVAIPIGYAGLAYAGLDERILIFVGVVAFLIGYTALDITGHPTRPIPGDWLRRRITINLVYLAVVGMIAFGVTRFLQS